MRRTCLTLSAALVLSSVAFAEEGWIEMFDGESFKGWKISENKDSWRIDDGAIVAAGPRSHLFYVANEKPFVNFEFKAKVMTTPGSNGGVYFHTKFQPTGWPKYGYEAQVNTTHGDRIKTGSLYSVKNVYDAPAKDNEWFDYSIRVEGKRVQTAVNGKTLIDFTEEPDRKPGDDFTRILDSGTFALQAHDPKSVVYFKDLKVRRLP